MPRVRADGYRLPRSGIYFSRYLVARRLVTAHGSFPDGIGDSIHNPELRPLALAIAEVLSQMQINFFLLTGTGQLKHHAIPALFEHDIGEAHVAGEDVDGNVLQMPGRQ